MDRCIRSKNQTNFGNQTDAFSKPNPTMLKLVSKYQPRYTHFRIHYNIQKADWWSLLVYSEIAKIEGKLICGD